MRVPTHRAGHTLDLFITRDRTDLKVSEPYASFYVSDHSFVECRVSSITKPPVLGKELSCRNLRSIDIEQFKQDILSSDLCNTEWTDVNDAAQCYNQTLSGLLDKHAPVCNKTVVSHPGVSWYSKELKSVKVQRRKAERTWCKDKCPETETEYHKIRNENSKRLRVTRCRYHSNHIVEASGNQKKLFKIIGDLTKCDRESPLPEHTDIVKLANDFQDFYAPKVDLIRKNIDNVQLSNVPDVVYNHPEVKFDYFSPLSEKEVRDIIMSSSSSSCLSDPIPTTLLKQCLDPLVPVITKIVIDREAGR